MNAIERRSTFALGSIFAIRMLGLFMLIPVFAVSGFSYDGATPALIGWSIGIYGLAQALLQIPMSLLADRYDRRLLIIIGLLVFALGAVVSALSEHIYGVIIGRAIAGAGAVSAVVMALLSDVTREEQRSKAMAFIGMSIGLSFMLAFLIGPWFTAKFGISALFWSMAIAAIVAIGLLALVPKVERHHRVQAQNYRQQLAQVLKNSNLNRLNLAIFCLHLLQTTLFVFVPTQLVKYANIPLDQHAWVYLPLFIISIVLLLPSVIFAEKYRKMRAVFLAAIGIISVSFLVFSFNATATINIMIALGLFLAGFNILEALIPSWISKIAPIESKATAMGVHSSCQFLGSFCGGLTAGVLLSLAQPLYGWIVLFIFSLCWLLVCFRIKSPRYLSSLVFKLKPEQSLDNEQILGIDGVEEVLFMAEQQVIYLKVDKQKLDETARQQLTHIIGKPLAI